MDFETFRKSKKADILVVSITADSIKKGPIDQFIMKIKDHLYFKSRVCRLWDDRKIGLRL